MAQVYNLDTLLAQASTPRALAPPAPPPVSTATPNPVAAPVVNTALFPGLGTLNTDAPAQQDDPNKSQFANMLGQFAINGTPGKLAAVQAQADTAAQAPTGWEYLKNFLTGNKATDAALAQRQSVANIVGHPVAQNIIANTPEIANLLKTDPVGTATKLQPLLDAAAGAPPATVNIHTPAGPVAKNVPDPAKLAALAQITGEHPDHVNPFVHHGDYTEDEFIAATQNLNWKQAARIFGAAQRLTPQQQVVNQYAGIVNENAQRAEAAYNEAVANKSPKAALDKLDAERKAANNTARDFLRKIAEGSNFLYPEGTGTNQ